MTCQRFTSVSKVCRYLDPNYTCLLCLFKYIQIGATTNKLTLLHGNPNLIFVLHCYMGIPISSLFYIATWKSQSHLCVKLNVILFQVIRNCFIKQLLKLE